MVSVRVTDSEILIHGDTVTCHHACILCSFPVSQMFVILSSTDDTGTHLFLKLHTSEVLIGGECKADLGGD